MENLLVSMDRLGRVEPVEVGLLGAQQVKLGASTVADRLVVFSPPEERPRLGPAYEKASAGGRRVRVERLAADAVAHRAALLEHVGDPAQVPRAMATRALLASGIRLTEQEAVPIEALLTRKASDLRRAALELLRTQAPVGVAASVQRLESGTAAQQDAARDLSGRARVEATGAAAPRAATATASEPDVLVVDDTHRTSAVLLSTPRLATDRAERCTRLVTSLIGWLDEHRDVEVRVGSEVRDLADVTWLPHVTPGEPLPLAEVLDPWWERVGPGLTDGGLECALVSDFGPLLTDRLRPPLSLLGQGCRCPGGRGGRRPRGRPPPGGERAGHAGPARAAHLLAAGAAGRPRVPPGGDAGRLLHGPGSAAPPPHRGPRAPLAGRGRPTHPRAHGSQPHR